MNLVKMIKAAFKPRVVTWQGKTGGTHYGTPADRRKEGKN